MKKKAPKRRVPQKRTAKKSDPVGPHDGLQELPEFRVTLERLKKGETAYPNGSDVPHDKYLGQRSKFGGRPDRIEGSEDPVCKYCGEAMVFVAQIDSVEHNSSTNPHAVEDWIDQKWMFVDAGMIYVYFCFECGAPTAEIESY